MENLNDAISRIGNSYFWMAPHADRDSGISDHCSPEDLLNGISDDFDDVLSCASEILDLYLESAHLSASEKEHIHKAVNVLFSARRNMSNLVCGKPLTYVF